jgi:hypothetical protein
MGEVLLAFWEAATVTVVFGMLGAYGCATHTRLTRVWGVGNT